MGIEIDIGIEKSDSMRARSVSVAWLAAAILSLGLLALPLVAFAANTTTITVKDFSFQPKTVTIRAGDTVAWANIDTATHTATSSGNWDTGSIAPGSSRSITFATSGTYLYFCLLHSIMFGTIVVVAAADATASPTIVPASAAGQATPDPASASQPSTVVLAAAPGSTAPPIVLRPPSEAGPGPIIVAGAALAVVALSAFAWLVARQV